MAEQSTTFDPGHLVLSQSQGLCQPGYGTKRVSTNLALSPSCWYPRYEDTDTEGEIPESFSKKPCFAKVLVGPRKLGLSYLFILKAGLVRDCLGSELKTQWVESMCAPEQALYLTSTLQNCHPLSSGAQLHQVCFVCMHLISLFQTLDVYTAFAFLCKSLSP